VKVLDKLTCTIDTNAHTPLAATMIDIPDVSGTTSHPVIVATVPSSHLVSCCLVPYFDTTVSLSFFNGLAAYNAIVPELCVCSETDELFIPKKAFVGSHLGL